MKSLASAISIGTGAAVGREGPIIQIGASLGSSLGQFIAMAPWQRITLVAAGAGAGIAATFNTPIGGVMFAIELMLPEISARTFLPVALATGTATFIGRIFLGLQPAFDVPGALLDSDRPASLAALLLYALLGALMGLAATAFIKGLSLAEIVFERIHNGYVRHAIGMLLIGAMMYVLLRTNGQYYVDGVGYATIQAILTGSLVLPGLLALLFVAQIVRDLDQPRFGRLGGIFSPSLFMGATIGRSVRCRDRRSSPHRRSRRHHLRDDRHGRHGRRRYRRGHDRSDHDLRDDARLRSGNADDRRGGAGDRRAADIVAARISTR